MKYCVLVWKRLPANAMAIFPFLIFKHPALKRDHIIINHEKIHFVQQIELLIFPFYLLYTLNYLLNLLRFKNHQQAYLNICFEKEAYANDHDLKYLSGRRLFSWIRYL